MLDTIREIICNFVPVEPEEIQPESKLLGDLGLSSLDLVMISVEIEKEFNIKIPDRLYTTVKTIGGLMEYIENETK